MKHCLIHENRVVFEADTELEVEEYIDSHPEVQWDQVEVRL
jgi:hypothetical protein